MKNRPLLLGHRGARASSGVLENTLSSFALALEHGCDGFEFDVRRDGTGAAVICHDPKFQGVTIARAKSGQLKSIPQLGEVLAQFSGCAFLDIELKVSGLDSELLVALGEHPPQRSYVVSSFLTEVLISLATRSEAMPLGFICDDERNLPSWQTLPVSYVILHYSLVTKDLVEQIRKKDKIVFVWTVNDPAAMLRFADWGVQGIISDDTELMVKTFS